MRLGLRRAPECSRPAAIVAHPTTQSSIALEVLLEYLDEAPRRVLDLGPPVADNVACYAHFGAKISIADFYRFFLPRRAEGLEGASVGPHLFRTLLPRDATRGFDVVLAWELLDYLSPDENTWLLHSLRELCSPGALLYALVASEGKLSLRPPVYTIEDEKTLRCDAPAPVRRPAPGYSEQALLRFMPQLEVERRYQLRNQRVEYLLRYR
jgi:hypothetical protein